MRILFMGTPDFAAASLRALVERGEEICAVFTQPDKPKNRGHKLAFPPVKDYALSQGLPVYQPVTLRDEAAAEQIRALSPELIVVAAYGKLLPETILRLPPLGCINVHASLLPRYRGAAPIQWAVLNGETETGVSMMYLAKELDAGDVILQKSVPIGEEEDAQSLTARLAELGAAALLEAVEAIRNGTAPRIPQKEEQATYAPMLSRDLSPVDWTRSAHAVACQIRGLIPWPCASTTLEGVPLKLYRAKETGERVAAAPGTVTAAGKTGIAVACGDGTALLLTELQPQNGKRMSAGAYLAGHSVPLGSLAGS